jgi:hypothetical protein
VDPPVCAPAPPGVRDDTLLGRGGPDVLDGRGGEDRCIGGDGEDRDRHCEFARKGSS